MNRNDELLRQGLRKYAAQIAATHTPPPASGIWLMAERRRRRLAAERAALPVHIMQVVGVVCAVAVAVWLLRGTGVNGAGLLHDVETLSTASLAMACGSILLAVAGCWAMLAAGRRVSP
jgi:protein-S-isoprenylcysteine O-methyltransferase Ste14